MTEDEPQLPFKELGQSIGSNLKQLIELPNTTYCFRPQKDRVYYIAEGIMKKAAKVARANLASLGVCFGKSTLHGNSTYALPV